MTSRPRRLMVLDTASLYFRAFFGVPDSMRAPDGTQVNAVRGLLDFIGRLVSTHEPTDLICAWDDDWRPQWRVDLIPTYKAHRVVRAIPDGVDVEETPDPLEVQIPMIEIVLEAFGIAVVGAAEHEADDVIGTLSRQFAGAVDIVTGDRDLFQLVADERDVRVLYVARGVGNLDVVDEGWVVRKYGILPEQYADFATLRGDASDGLPGVKGVGEKTAASLLQQYGDLAGIVAAAADPTTSMATGLRAKLVAAADYLAVAPTVVEVVCDLDLPEVDSALVPLTEERSATVAELTKRWGLGSSAGRVTEALAAYA
ncbi:MAG: 5'-3' exonuclease [Nocardioidaceae bacterium]